MSSVFTPGAETYEQASIALHEGKLVAFPTETVYGLGANALDADAVRSIFAAKGRPSDNPLIVHLADKSQIATYASVSNDIEQMLIDRLMPGPFTLLLKTTDNSLAACTAGRDRVGIRIPSHAVAHALLKASGLPIAAPSANISGKPSPTNAQLVAQHLHDKDVMIIDGGASEIGIESTTVLVQDGEVSILRPGFITLEDIQDALPGISVTYAHSEEAKKLSPGMRYTHYSPAAKVSVVATLDEAMLEGEWVVVIGTDEFLVEQKDILRAHRAVKILPRGSRVNLVSCAQSLFSLYHTVDALGLKKVLIESLPEEGLGLAIMNRVKKSAGLL